MFVNHKREMSLAAFRPAKNDSPLNPLAVLEAPIQLIFQSVHRPVAMVMVDPDVISVFMLTAHPDHCSHFHFSTPLAISSIKACTTSRFC